MFHGTGCTTNPEIPPRKAEFPIFYKLRITGLFLEKETYTGTPRADPLRTLNNFYQQTFVSSLGRFELLTHASEL